MAETRGIRNNNPFNIKRSSSRWLGKVSHQHATDKVFEQFSDIDYGLRAGFILFRNYINQGFNTYRKILTRFAPPSENNVSLYIRFTSGDLEYDPDKVFLFRSIYYYNLVDKICFYESRYNLTYEHYLTILQKFKL